MSKLFRQRWAQIFGVGALLFFGAEQVLKHTGNPNLVPTVILLGAFLIPATFIAFFSTQERNIDKERHHEMPLSFIATCFLVGGVVGSVTAGLLEYQAIRSAAVSNMFTIAVIEEAAKLIFPITIFVQGRYRSEVDGLLLGVTSGMGFAALETMGYGLVALVNSQGNIGTLEEVLLIRGLLSPVGHAAWTGLVCAFTWRQREKTGKAFSFVPVAIFALVVVFHAVWNLSGSFSHISLTYLTYAAIGVIGLTMLILRLRDSRLLVPKKVADV